MQNMQRYLSGARLLGKEHSEALHDHTFRDWIRKQPPLEKRTHTLSLDMTGLWHCVLPGGLAPARLTRPEMEALEVLQNDLVYNSYRKQMDQSSTKCTNPGYSDEPEGKS